MTLKRGATVAGRLLNRNNTSPSEVLMEWRGEVRSEVPYVRGLAEVIHGGTFRLTGIDATSPTPVFLLDSVNNVGAVFDASAAAGDEDAKVQLQPCGSATARYVDAKGRPMAGHPASLDMVVTPGPPEVTERDENGDKLLADQIIVANFDRLHYWDPPRSDAAGHVTLPALIPGATYRLFGTRNGKAELHEFSVGPGQALDLGDVELEPPEG